MVDKDGNSLSIGDLVVLNENVQPKYVGGALCRVTGLTASKVSCEVEKMKPGRNMSSPRFKEGSRFTVRTWMVRKA